MKHKGDLTAPLLKTWHGPPLDWEEPKSYMRSPSPHAICPITSLTSASPWPPNPSNCSHTDLVTILWTDWSCTLLKVFYSLSPSSCIALPQVSAWVNFSWSKSPLRLRFSTQTPSPPFASLKHSHPLLPDSWLFLLGAYELLTCDIIYVRWEAEIFDFCSLPKIFSIRNSTWNAVVAQIFVYCVD